MLAKILRLFAACCVVFAGLVPAPTAYAQPAASALVVSSCGTLPSGVVYAQGQTRSLTQDTTGTSCGAGGGGGSGTVTTITAGTNITLSSGATCTTTCTINSSSASSGANPTATAGPAAVNGSATTFMRSDGSPAVQKASNAQFGIMEGDTSTISCTAGVCSTVGGGSGNALFGTTSGNVSGDVVSMSNTTTGVQDSGIAVANLANVSTAHQSSGSVTVSAAQFLHSDGFIATAAVTLIYPATSTLSAANGSNYLNAQGGAITITPNTGDQVCVDGTCGSASVTYVLAQGNSGWVTTNGTGQLQVGLSLGSASGGSGCVPAGSSGQVLLDSGSGNCNDSTGLTDNGTKVTAGEPIDLTSKPLVDEIANAGTTGTTVNLLAKLTGAPSTAVVLGTSDTLFQGIVIAGAGTTGNAQIARDGQASCVFDGATTAGDWVIPSTTTGGDCHDSGSTALPSQQVVGRVLSTNGAGGTYAVEVSPQNPGASTGSGSSQSPVTYQSGDWYFGGPYTSVAAGTAIGTGKIIWTPVTIYKSETLLNLGTRITTLDSGGNISLAVYANGTCTGTPNYNCPVGSALANANSISTTTATNVSGSVSVALTPGLYWFGAMADNTTVAIQAINTPSAWIAYTTGETSQANLTGGNGSAYVGLTTSGTSFNTWPTNPTTASQTSSLWTWAAQFSL